MPFQPLNPKDNHCLKYYRLIVPCLYSSYTWNYTVCVIQCLPSSAQHFFVRFIVCSSRLFILVTIECSTVELNHDEFIHSATYRHLSSIQFATVMNSAVINIFVTYLLISRIYTQRCCHMVGACLALGVHLFFVCLFGYAVLQGLFSSCGERGLLFMRCEGFSLLWLLLLQSTGSRALIAAAYGFHSCGSPGSGAQAQ